MNAHPGYDVLDSLPVATLRKAIGGLLGHEERAEIERRLTGQGIGQGKRFTFFNYGRNALYTLLRERCAGSEVIFPGFICPSLALAALRADARPWFVDVSLDDFNLDASLLSPELLERAGALLVNHTFGVPADVDRIRSRPGGERVYLVEDIAQALFSRCDGSPAGARGDAVLVSMYKQVPNIHGAVIISEPGLENRGTDCGGPGRLLLLTRGPHQSLLRYVRRRRALPAQGGEKSRPAPARPSRLAQAIFAASLPDLEAVVEGRRAILRHYQDRARASEYLVPQQIREGKEPSCFNFSVRLLPELAHVRDEAVLALRRKGIFCDRLWHDSPVALGVFRDYLAGDCPNSRLLARSVINLPVKASYDEHDVGYLFDSVEEAVRRLV